MELVEVKSLEAQLLAESLNALFFGLADHAFRHLNLLVDTQDLLSQILVESVSHASLDAGPGKEEEYEHGAEFDEAVNDGRVMVVVTVLEVEEEVDAGIVLNARLLAIRQVLSGRLTGKVHLVVCLSLAICIDECLRNLVHSLRQLVLHLLIE